MQVVGFTLNGAIEAGINGETWFIPDDLTNSMRQMIAEWEAEGNVIPAYDPSPSTLADARVAKLAELSAKRYAVETGGMVFNGIPLRTDRETAGIITAAYVTAMADPDYVVENWKVADGVFVVLDAPTIIAIATALRDFVQVAFNRDAALSAVILALTTVAEVNGYDVDAAW